MNAPNNLPFNFRRNEKMKISDFLTRTSSVNFLRSSLDTDLRDSSQIGMKGRLFFARQKRAEIIIKKKYSKYLDAKDFKKCLWKN